jgi:hypothetical protein
LGNPTMLKSAKELCKTLVQAANDNNGLEEDDSVSVLRVIIISIACCTCARNSHPVLGRQFLVVDDGIRCVGLVDGLVLSFLGIDRLRRRVVVETRTDVAGIDRVSSTKSDYYRIYVNYRPSYSYCHCHCHRRLWNHPPNDAIWKKGDQDGGQRQCHQETLQLQPVTILRLAPVVTREDEDIVVL